MGGGDGPDPREGEQVQSGICHWSDEASSQETRRICIGYCGYESRVGVRSKKRKM